MRHSLALATLSLAIVASSETTLSDRAVSDTIFANIKFYAQYAGASYCSNNDNSTSTGDAVTCTDDVCPTVESDKATTFLEFDQDSLTDEVGFIAIDESRKDIVLSYRGSSSIRNFIDDILFSKTDCDFGDGCEAHAGFMAAFENTSDVVLPAIQEAVANYTGYSLIVTGHSLGGAVATIAAATIRESGLTAALYTYGSPRVFNAAGATYVTAQSGGNYRTTHLDDPVPRLPPILLSYNHISPEYWLGTGIYTTTDYVASDVTICVGTANTTCNAGESGFDTTAHSYYFEDISACAPTLGFKRDVSKRALSDTQIENLMSIDVVYANALNAAS